MSEYQELSPMTPHQIKDVINDALSPIFEPASESASPGHEVLLGASADRDGKRDAVKQPNRHGIMNEDYIALSPSFRMPDSFENTPLLGKRFRSQHLFSSPGNLPNTPSPLCRAIPWNSTSPILSHHVPSRPQLSSSPIRRTTSETYEVEAPFLQAVVGLLERQAHIVPEHLFTKSDVQAIVRKELQEYKQGIESKSEIRLAYPNDYGSYITPQKIGIAGTLGGMFGMSWHILTIHPSEWAVYMGSMFKGAVCGLGSALVMKGVLKGLDRLSNE